MATRLDDIRFALEATAALHAPWDRETTLSILEPLDRFSQETLAPADALADQQGCRIEKNRVRMPDGLREAYTEYVDLGGHLLTIPEAHGGLGAPPLVTLPATELLAGGSHAFQMVTGLVAGACEVLEACGTQEQQERLIGPLAAGECLVTMCLSEPNAGSDLGAIRTRASPDESGSWWLTGEKIFISGGDQDLTPAVLHLVLARTGTVEQRTAGLSLFACPSHLPNGERNANSVVRIEEKLGLHGSPTCQLRFEGARAELIGAPGDGLKAMFVMMNRARLEVGLQGVALGFNACAAAKDYAQSRNQGGGVIAHHPDVSRMLMEMDALVMGGRAMCYRTAGKLDDANLAAFLTPVCKVFCTEMVSRVTDQAMQVLGGYGYLPEYRVEQFWRDSRVTRLYEGTNGILAANLVKRLINLDDGALAHAFVEEVNKAADEPVRQMLDTWQACLAEIREHPEKLMAAWPFMQLTGLLFFASCWVRLEKHASNATDPERIERSAHFVRAAILPEAEALGQSCKNLLSQHWRASTT